VVLPIIPPRLPHSASRFRLAVWMVMNPDRGFSDVEEDSPAWEVLERAWKSAMEFSDLEYRDLALRRILSDQSLLDKLIKNLMIIIKAVLCMRVITGAKTRTLAQIVQAAYQGFSFSCTYSSPCPQCLSALAMALALPVPLLARCIQRAGEGLH
jgi:hypothetical protein